MKISLWFSVLLTLLSVNLSHGASATWNLNPTSGDWYTAVNWIPNTVPNSATDVATFGTSAGTDVTLTTFGFTTLATLQFNPGADSFSFSIFQGADLSFGGDGIVNNSGKGQQFTVSSNASVLSFNNSASAGEGTNFSVLGGAINFNAVSSAATAHFTVSDDSGVGGEVFFDTSTAANATFDVAINGTVSVSRDATAGNATFTIAGGTLTFDFSGEAGESVIDCSEGGQVIFQNVGAKAVGSPQVTAHGASSSRGRPGSIRFTHEGIGDHGTFVVAGGMGALARGAVMHVLQSSDLQNAQVTITGGTDGGLGGSIIFSGPSDGGSANIAMSGNATFDINTHDPGSVSIGSIVGEGTVFLGANQLSVGNNNLSTAFSGVIQDTGSLTKVGTGTLTLSGANNTYTNGTTILSGSLKVNNTAGSGTGAGAVQVSGGILGGKGIIGGAVTIGTGGSTGSALQPGVGAITPTTLTLQATLTFQSDSTYTWKLNTKKAKADQVLANGVTISNGAQFDLTTVGNKKLPAGKVFTAINNTSATPISGIFANLADGSTVIVGVNKLQVSYSGGDGNDLTLTVVP